MKKAIFISAFLFIASFTTKAQGDLQFNQVLLYELPIQVAVNFTVPSGKVWKIVAAGGDPYNSPSIYLRNSGGEILSPLYYESTSNRSVLPYWLPENYSGQFYHSNYSGSEKGSVSIIEFNVVP